MIRTRWFAVGVVTLSALGVFVPSTAFAQQGPDDTPGRGAVHQQQRPGTQEGPGYHAKSEATFRGIVADVKSGRTALYWFSRIHTLGLGHMPAPETQLLLKTDMETVQIQLGPTAFLAKNKVEIGEGDMLEVIGSRVTIGESHVVLAREIRKGGNAWMLRDVAGQPLWSSVQTEARGFWTTKKVLLIAVFSTIILLIYMGTFRYMAAVAADPSAELDVVRNASPGLHAALALLVLLVATVLAVYKPRGMTPYGQRKQHEQRTM